MNTPLPLLTDTRRATRICITVGGGVTLALCALLLMAPHWPAAQRAALNGGMLCALGTALGAVPVLFMRRVSATSSDCLLGFGAGVMLAATAFSLLIPALDVAGAQGHGAWTAALLVSVGLLAGGGGLLAVDRLLLRHLGPDSAAARHSAALSPVLLFVIAIVAHNVPEGMAVGVAAAGDQPTGLALGIALQDLPEGLVVAMMLAAAGMARGKAFLCGAASGVVEPLAAVIAAWLTGLSHSLLPWGLALAAGAMLVAVVHEIVPELHRNDHSTAATLALCAGFAVMLILDSALA